VTRKPAPYPDSYYAATQVAAGDRPPLAETIDADVCVVGGGLAGLTAALELTERGRSVVLVEAERVGWGASGRNGGFVSPGYSQDLDVLERSLGVDHARRLYDLSVEGVEMVVANIDRFAMRDVDLEHGVLSVSRHDAEDAFRAAVQHARETYGSTLDYWDRERVRSVLHTTRYHQGLLRDEGVHIHPLNYVLQLATACEAAGVRIFEATKALRVARVGDAVHVRCEVGEVRAEHIVLSVSGYGRGLRRDLDAAVLPVATYVVAGEANAELLDTAIGTKAAIADTRLAGDYYRRLRDGRLLWGGRITTKRAEPARLARLLKRDIVAIYPQLAPLEIEYAWPGLMGYAVHKMPIVRRLEPGIWSATAFGGHGLNTTAIGGRVIAEAIAGESDRIDLFAPFGARWGGGAIGRAGTQAVYWWYQWRDRRVEARAQAQERAAA